MTACSSIWKSAIISYRSSNFFKLEPRQISAVRCVSQRQIKATELYGPNVLHMLKYSWYVINQTFNNSSPGPLTDLKKGPGMGAETAIVVVASQWKSHTTLPDVYPVEKRSCLYVSWTRAKISSCVSSLNTSVSGTGRFKTRGTANGYIRRTGGCLSERQTQMWVPGSMPEWLLCRKFSSVSLLQGYFFYESQHFYESLHSFFC